MKTKLYWMIAVMGLGSFMVRAQETSESSVTYWVIEGNIKTKDYTLIRFYNEKNELVREERLEGRFLDITKKRNVKFLNAKLAALKNSDTLATKQNGRKTKKKII